MNFGILQILINVFDDKYIVDSKWEQIFLLWELIDWDVQQWIQYWILAN